MDGYKGFKEWQNIKVKEAGKCGSVVILSKSHYKSMILSQISDVKAYKKLNSNLDHAIMKKNKSFNNKVQTITHRFTI